LTKEGIEGRPDVVNGDRKHFEIERLKLMLREFQGDADLYEAHLSRLCDGDKARLERETESEVRRLAN
jgi:hypothetical protein